ncbi:MAG: formylglycine-generating enzyme family protein, partial [Acidobacteriota bacterium]
HRRMWSRRTALAWMAQAARGQSVGARAGEEREVAGVKLCWCPPGKFRMGSPESEVDHRGDEAQVDVTLTRGYWMGKHEVTQGQWARAMGAFPQPQDKGVGDDFPVHWVSFLEAEAFCAKLAAPEGWGFRLPTEAEWEYACRAGTETAFSFGETIDERRANYGDALKRASKVGSYPTNAWGLHDMHGNVWEYCRDWYHAKLPGGIDPDRAATKGQANRDGTYSKVRRGGAWIDKGWACRSAMRLRYEPERRSDHIGFRVVMARA